MTRTEFLDGITEWHELKEFCNDEGCEICDDIVSDSDRDEQIDDDLENEIRDESWRTIKDYLDGIDTGYEYYLCNGRFDYDGLDDNDFESYKNDVMEWADDNDRWDTEEDEDEDDYDIFEEELASKPEEEDGPMPEAEDFSVCDLIGMCCATLITIQNEDNRRASEEDAEFRRLYPKVLK